MEFDDGGEVLCVMLKDKWCLIDFEAVVEICGGVRISKLPGLSTRFCGVCDYKGTILPVFDGRQSQNSDVEKELLVVVAEPNGKFGILAQGDAHIMSLQGTEQVIRPERDGGDEDVPYRILQKDGRLFYRIDIAKMLESLSLRPI